MTIGILKTDTVRPEWVGRFGEYPDMFEVLLRQVDPSLEFQTWDAEAGELPDDLSAVDGFIITGSKSSVYDDKPWIRGLEDFVRLLCEGSPSMSTRSSFCFSQGMAKVGPSTGGS